MQRRLEEIFAGDLDDIGAWVIECDALAGDCVAAGVEGHGVAVGCGEIILQSTTGGSIEVERIAVLGQDVARPVGVIGVLSCPGIIEISDPCETGREDAIFEQFGAPGGSDLRGEGTVALLAAALPAAPGEHRWAMGI